MKLHSLNIEIVQGNIVNQPDISAIVNAANPELRIGGGVAGAIHQASGPQLTVECKAFAPIKPGEAVITSAPNLPNNHVIHCLGPVYGRDKPEDKLLANCYKNAMELAEKYKINSIAFPAISTGAYGYPIEKATDVVISTIRAFSKHAKHLQNIRFVLFSQHDLKVYQEKFESHLNV